MGQDIFQCPVFLLLTAKQKKKICNLIIRFSEAKIYRTSRAISSVQFSRSVMSDFLWPHGLKHARPPCPSPTLRACSNSCPSSWWCHQTISSSVIPFSWLQSFPALGSFPVTKHDLLEKGMANHFIILALRTPWTVWEKDKQNLISNRKDWTKSFHKEKKKLFTTYFMCSCLQSPIT